MGRPEQPLNTSKGCGGLMRVAPVGLALRIDDSFGVGCDIAALTHRVIILHDGRVVYDEPGPAIGGPPIPHVKTLGGTTPPPAADGADAGSSAWGANS